MINGQLLTYIREQAARGVQRSGIGKALLLSGWPIQEVNEALTALNVSMDNGSSEVPASTEHLPVYQVPMAGPEPILTTPSSMPISAPVASMAPKVPPSPEKLPGVFALIMEGIAIYRERIGPLCGMAAIQVVLALGVAGLFGALVVFGAIALLPFILLAVSMPYLLIVLGLIIGIPLLIGMAWLFSWTPVAQMQLIRGHLSRIGFREAFAHARPQVWSFIWVNALVGFLVAACLAVPAAILFVLSTTLALTTNPFMIGIDVIAGIAAVLIAVMFGVQFSFGAWIVVDTSERGSTALRLSRTIVQQHGFWAIAGRLIGLGFSFGIVGIVISLLFQGLGVLVGNGLVRVLANIVPGIFNAFVLSPIVVATAYSLYAVALTKLRPA